MNPNSNHKSLLIVFAYAPTGLGHLRVTDALYHGLNKQIPSVLLGSQDVSISHIYRFITIHPITRRLMELVQSGVLEELFVYFYRNYLRLNINLTYQQITTILDERLDTPQTILFVATHFGLAHKLGALKEKLSANKKIKVLLVVQVTDDTPQHIWYVKEADVIFCPSTKTARALKDYAKRMRQKEDMIMVTPYPVNPLLNHELPESLFEKRMNQFKKGEESIHVCVPISGAAVGLDFYTKLIDSLHTFSQRFRFHIVVRSSPFTQAFINEMLKRGYVELHTAQTDRQIVDEYTEIYKNEIIGLEITKPSEQAFKALVEPHKRGGTLLLFSEPIGKQEADNLDFLRRHNLIPSVSQQNVLWNHAKRNEIITHVSDAICTRGLELPSNPKDAAQFIWWVYKEELFLKMLSSRITNHNDERMYELQPNGVEEFWMHTMKLLEE